MNIRNYISSQLLLTNNQIKKNKKYSKGYIKDKTYDSITHPKTSQYSSFDASKKDEKNMLNDENKLFFNLYTKTKELYPTKITETFKDLITKYRDNNYKIPDLSDKKNLFKQNPLLFVGTELEHYYRGINTANNLNLKTNVSKKNKHINFIKKEMLMLENIIYNRSNGSYDKNKELCNESSGANYKMNERGNKKHEFNYFQVDNVWDKIKREKQRIKQEKLNKKRIMQKNLMKNLKSQSLQRNIPDDDNTKQSNYVHKSTDYNINKMNSLSSFKANKNSFNATKNNSNSKDTITLKNMNSVSTEYKYNTMNSFSKLRNKLTNKSISPKKVKFKLLKLEEKNKLIKDIEDTKNTLNNIELIDDNKTIEEYKNKRKPNKTINFDKVLGKYFFNHNKNKTIRLSKYFSQRLKGPLLLNLFGQKAIKNSILKKLSKETDPKKIKETYMKLNLEMFDQNEIEKLIKIYYEKILGHSQQSINKIIKLHLGDDLICELLDKYIAKSKEKLFKYSTNPRVNKSLDKANEQIKSLKKRYLVGKTLEILD